MPLPAHLRLSGLTKGRIVAAPPPPAEVLPVIEEKKEEIAAAPTPPAVVAPAPAPSVVRADDPPASYLSEDVIDVVEKRCDTCGNDVSPAGCSCMVRFNRPEISRPAGQIVPSNVTGSTVARYAVAIAFGALVGYGLAKMRMS